MSESMLERARSFVALRRIALVGLERSEKGFSRVVFRALAQRGCEVVAVNPALAQAEGRRCYARVQDIDPPVQGALLMTPPGSTAQAVRDCLDAGVRHIWFHRGVGKGSATPEAIELCRKGGVQPIVDLCPFMALPEQGWFHGLHGFLRRAPWRRPEL
jgi:predicted CoA-binding protein